MDSKFPNSADLPEGDDSLPDTVPNVGYLIDDNDLLDYFPEGDSVHGMSSDTLPQVPGEERLAALTDEEYREIIAYTVREYETVNTKLHMLLDAHNTLHSMNQVQASKLKECLGGDDPNVSINSTGAFAVVEEAVNELSRLHQHELDSIKTAKTKEIQTIKDTFVTNDDRVHLLDQIEELKSCLVEVTNYMKRNDSFTVPENTAELCKEAKQYIVANHAVNIADLESHHMLEVNRLKVEHDSAVKALEMKHSYRLKDAVAKYDALLFEKEEDYQEQLRGMDDKVYSLQSELTMLKGHISQEEHSPRTDNDVKSPSDEFIVHHSPQFTDTNKVEFVVHEVLSTPKKEIPRRQAGVRQRSQSVRHKPATRQQAPLKRGKSFSGPVPPSSGGVTGIRRPSARVPTVKSGCAQSNKPAVCERCAKRASTQHSEDSTQTESDNTDNVSVQTTYRVVHMDTQTEIHMDTQNVGTQTHTDPDYLAESKQEKNAAKQKSKYNQHVEELDNLWADLVPVDESYLLDSSTMSCPFTPDLEREVGEEKTAGNATDDLFSDKSEFLQTQPLFVEPGVEESLDMPLYGSQVTETSAAPQTLASNALQGKDERPGESYVPISALSELQHILLNKNNELEGVRKELESAVQENHRLHMLNTLHIENELAKVSSQPCKLDVSCSPILLQDTKQTDDTGDQGVRLVDAAVNTSYVLEDGMQSHPHKSNLTSLLSRLNLEDSKLGNVGDESVLNTTSGPDLSFFDLTLTTGLADNPNNQTLLLNHLSDIQSEAMKIHDRSEELCRENEKLQNAVQGLQQDLQVERGKVRGRIRDLKDERDKCKKLEHQLTVNNEQNMKNIEELNKNKSKIKANKESHKQKLEETVTCYKKQIDNLTAAKQLTEEQAKGLAKIINNTDSEPKSYSTTDCQTSLVFSNFVLHMSTDPTTVGCTERAENDSATLSQELVQLQDTLATVQQDYRALQAHAVQLEDNYSRQNQENNALIEITNNEKAVLLQEMLALQEQVRECEEILSTVPTPISDPLLSIDEGLGLNPYEISSKLQNVSDSDTVNFTQLSNTSQPVPHDAVVLSEATSHLVGMFKTSTEQVQELQQALLVKSTAHQDLLRKNSNLQIELQKREAELSTLKLSMVAEEDVQAKLLDANKTIAKLKGEILKLSTEVQQGGVQQNNTDDALIEENEELKNQVDKLEEIKLTLLSDVQLLREQLDEEHDVNENTRSALQEANSAIEHLQSQLDAAEEESEEGKKREETLQDKVKQLEAQLVELQDAIKREKETTKELLEKADDVSSLKNRKKRELEDLMDEMDKYKADTRRKNQELDELQDLNRALERKLAKLQPSLDSYEEVNNSLKNKLKDTKDLAADFEQRQEMADKDLRKAKTELHVAKEELSSAEEKIEKLLAALEELQAALNVRKKSTATQAAVSMYEVGSNCTLLASATDPGLQSKYEELKLQYEQVARDLEYTKRQKGDIESQLQNLFSQQSSKENLLLQLQQEHSQALERLRNTLTAEKGEALSALKKDMEETKEAHKAAVEELKEAHRRLVDELKELHRQELAKIQEAHRLDLQDIREKLTAQESLKMDRMVSDMEIKRQQDTALIARKVGLDPETLSTLLPGSAQLTDRVEALHNQAIQIRDLALTFYEASHPPTREAYVQAVVKSFKCATQTVERKEEVEVVKETAEEQPSITQFIKVFKEEHDKQTEVLLSQLRTTDKPPPSPPSDDINLLKEELERLRLSIETYTTRCAMLEHNNRLLKDRNSGLENDLMISATQHHSTLLGEDSEHYPDQHPGFRPYDSHLHHRQQDSSQQTRARLADCQRQISNLHNNIAQYQDTMEQLELENEDLKKLKEIADKRARAAESDLIEYKNDKILLEDNKDEAFNNELTQAKESTRLLERDNKKLKDANSKLKNLNIALMQSNEKLKHTDAENFMLNISAKSNTLISEIDSIKAVEDLKFQLVSRETEVERAKNRVALLEGEVESKTNMVNTQRDELHSKEKVIQLIKSEMSAQQLDLAEIKAMLDIERSKSGELERRVKCGRLLPDKSDQVAELYSEVKQLRADNCALLRDNGADSPNATSKRVTRAYIKYLRAEGARKALVFQKQYLLSLLSKARAVESAALSILEIKKENSRRKRTFKEVGVAVLAMVRMKTLVKKWSKIKQSLEEKQRLHRTVSNSNTPTEHRPPPPAAATPPPPAAPTLYPPIRFTNFSPDSTELSGCVRSSRNTSHHSGYPRWDSSRPLSPPSHPRDGITSRVYGSPSPDASLSRLDQQLARLRHTINSRSGYNERSSDNRISERLLRDKTRAQGHVISDNALVPERDSGIAKPAPEDDGSGTLSDISNYIVRLEAVQSRLTDLKLSSYKMYETNS